MREGGRGNDAKEGEVRPMWGKTSEEECEKKGGYQPRGGRVKDEFIFQKE